MKNLTIKVAIVLLSGLFLGRNAANADPCAGGICPPHPTDPPPCTEDCCPPGGPGGPPGPPGGPPGPDKGDKTKGGDSGGSGCSSCGGEQLIRGMAAWWVSEPWLNLRLEDEALGYQPARGPRVAFRLSYRQNRAVAEYPTIFGVGTNWSCSFRAYVYQDPNVATAAYLHRGGAAWAIYVTGSAQTRDGSLLTALGGGSGYKIEHRNGALDTYSTIATNTDGDVFYFLTTIADPAGNVNTYTYSTNSGVFRLDTVTDADGNVTHLYYENGSFPAQITKVVAPYLRTNLLYYDAQGYLTNSLDPIGLSSSFKYDSGANRGWITNLSTPYGPTGFRFGTLTNELDPFVEVTLPTGGKHLFLYREHSDSLSSWAPTVPNTWPFSNTFELFADATYPYYNSYHWGPLQYVALSTTDPDNFTTNDYSKGRMRHWLFADGDGALSIERAHSPDGTTEGQVTFYDYENKYLGWHHLTGDSAFPSFVAQVLPDGSTHFSYSLRGPHLNVTNEIETYTALNGSVALRTNVMSYAANAVDLVQWLGPNGEQVVSNYFAPGNTIHMPNASYDALNHEALYTYNGYGQLTSTRTPAGLTSTNIYYSGGGSINRLATNIDLEISRTNSYTWSDGLVATHTDPRRLVTTSYWDKLQRFVGMSYPDGSTISNRYTTLDVTARKDRLGQWTYFGFNEIRQMVAATNENGVVTRYGYCDCGALLSQTNAWSTPVEQAINFSYDYQGNRWRTVYADGYSVTNWFDSLRRVTTTGDGRTYRYFAYNNQGLVTNVSNTSGPEQKTMFDIEDRPVYASDINGVTVTNTYDELNRLRTRTYPDGGEEKFGYSARGLVAYTNQLNLTNFYVYDEARRKIFETNANAELICYTNSPAGDVLSLTDGKVQTTRWGWDEYGRVTNKTDQAGTEILRYKYDANGRLTNRWSIEKGNTYYAYDPVGNLTNIYYAGSPGVSFAYDALNRRTSMLDVVGTTAYTYSTGNQLLTEDGPWGSDTVTNTYLNRLRTQMALAQPTGFWTNGFTYDVGARLSNVIIAAGTFVYTYRAASTSRQPINLLLPNTSYITNVYDGNARLTATYLKKNDNTVLDSYAYVYDLANERTALTRADSSTVGYSYDKIGQLKIADSSVNAEDRGYAYDAAWNLNWRTNNGSAAEFKVNSVNELTNAPSPVATQIYDGNGNLRTNRGGDRIFIYDDENRLVEYYRFNVGTVNPTKLTQFVYDGIGRLRKRIESHWEDSIEESIIEGETDVVISPGDGNWVTDSVTLYVYDGWRVIQERDVNNTPTVTYTRGSDLSGTMEGAGGIGGLLARSSGYSGGNWSTHNYYFADGNGNIAYVVDSSQTLAASYRYDPFGNTISSSGSLASANVYRFSSKELHIASGMYYYGYRFYDPNLQRWINRDPITETGFALLASPLRTERPEDPDGVLREDEGDINLYGFAINRPTLLVDTYGLDWRKWLPWNWPWHKILPPWNLPSPPFPRGSTFCPWPPEWTDKRNPPGTPPLSGKTWRGFGFTIPID